MTAAAQTWVWKVFDAAATDAALAALAGETIDLVLVLQVTFTDATMTVRIAEKLAAPLAWVKRHSRGITFVSAGVLFFFGVILLTDNLSQVTARLTDAMDALGLSRLYAAATPPPVARLEAYRLPDWERQGAQWRIPRSSLAPIDRKSTRLNSSHRT